MSDTNGDLNLSQMIERAVSFIVKDPKLFSMPLELLLMFAESMDPKTLVCYSMTCKTLYRPITSSRTIWTCLLRASLDATLCIPGSVNIPSLSLEEIKGHVIRAPRLEYFARRDGKGLHPSRTVTFDQQAKFILGYKNKPLRSRTKELIYLHLLPGGRWLLGCSIIDGRYVMCCWDAQGTPGAQNLLLPRAHVVFEHSSVAMYGYRPEMIPQHDAFDRSVNILCAYLPYHAEFEGDDTKAYVIEIFSLVFPPDGGVRFRPRAVFPLLKSDPGEVFGFALDGDYVFITYEERVVVWNWRANTRGFVSRNSLARELILDPRPCFISSEILTRSRNGSQLDVLSLQSLPEDSSSSGTLCPVDVRVSKSVALDVTVSARQLAPPLKQGEETLRAMLNWLPPSIPNRLSLVLWKRGKDYGNYGVIWPPQRDDVDPWNPKRLMTSSCDLLPGRDLARLCALPSTLSHQSIGQSSTLLAVSDPQRSSPANGHQMLYMNAQFFASSSHSSSPSMSSWYRREGRATWLEFRAEPKGHTFLVPWLAGFCSISGSLVVRDSHSEDQFVWCALFKPRFRFQEDLALDTSQDPAPPPARSDSGRQTRSTRSQPEKVVLAPWGHSERSSPS